MQNYYDMLWHAIPKSRYFFIRLAHLSTHRRRDFAAEKYLKLDIWFCRNQKKSYLCALHGARALSAGTAEIITCKIKNKHKS